MLTITYRDVPAALVDGDQLFLAAHLTNATRAEADRAMVTHMAAYAAQVLRDQRPGPYRDQDARAYARTMLIPDDLLEHPPTDLARAAAALNVPIDELRQALAASMRSTPVASAAG